MRKIREPTSGVVMNGSGPVLKSAFWERCEMLRANVCGRLLLLGSITLAGCGTPLPAGAKPTKPTKATVIYQGKPVEGAIVTFIYQGDPPVSAIGTTDAQGVAKMKTPYADGAVVGSNKVMITKIETSGEQPSVDQNSPDYKPPTGNEPRPVVKYSLTPKYADFAKTDPTAEVNDSSANEFKFELKE